MGSYERNLEALKVNHPELVERLDQPIDARHIEVVYARSGAPRLLVRREDGTQAAVHNEDDPVAVAERTIEKIELGEEGILVLFGMGLGYLPQALFSRMKERHALIVYEADLAIFRAALEQTDLADLLESKRVKVLVGPEVKLEPWFYHFLIKFGGKLQAIQYHPAFKIAPETYEQKLHREFLPFVNATGMNLTTITAFGRLFAQNVVEAIPEVVNTPGVNRLKDLFPQRPAILVAGGPSLAKNVDLLRRAKGRAVLIAADTMTGYLLARGIAPDFVVSVDPQELTYGKYHGVDIPQEVALVYHPGCSEKIFKHFPGPKFATATSMAPYLWLSPFWGEKDNIEGDTQCQMHLGFNLARWLGADPIVFVGQDLCYTDRRMHAKGGSYLTPEKEEQIVSQGLMTTDIFGERVGTYPVFDSYRATFERKIKDFPGRCIQATEGGVRIEGAEVMRLEDALAEFDNLPPIEVSSVLRSLPAEAETVRWGGLIREVREREKDLARIERLARQVLKLIEGIERIQSRAKAPKGDPDALLLEEEREQGIDHPSSPTPSPLRSEAEAGLLAQRTAEAERATTQIQRYGKALDLLPLLAYPLELYLLREETVEIDALEDQEERLEKQLERGRRYYGDLVRVVPPFREGLHRLADRLEGQRRLDRRLKSARTAEDWMELADGYAAIDRYDRAIRSLERAIECSGPTAAVCLRIGNLYLLRNQLSKARERFEHALACDPQDAEARAGRDACMEQLGKWEERVQAARQEEQERKPPRPLEAGDFYSRVGNFQRAVAAYQQAIVQHPDLLEAYGRLAQAYLVLGEPERAVEALEQHLQRAPSDPVIYYQLGQLALEFGQVDSAERFLGKGAEVSSNDPGFCGGCGDLFLEAGDCEKAVAFYQRGLEAGPIPELLRKIAEAYQRFFSGTEPLPESKSIR